jgi:4-coumarate--CoA ligase (photoactive yellow protein activation family)
MSEQIVIPRPDLARLVISLVADELGIQRGRPIATDVALAWTEATRLDDEPSPDGSLAFDSLARLDVAGRLNAFFHLHESGVEDYLLTAKTVGGLIDVVAASLKLTAERFTFQTSGSTGSPKPCTHPLALLRQEVKHLASLFPGVSRIVSLVPPHHIYGCLFTVMLPGAVGVPVLEGRNWGAGRLAAELPHGSLLVATPHQWSYLARSLPVLPAGVTGVTSTAPMPASLSATLMAQGLADLVEIYGSSETAGIGARRSGEAAFSLFPYWRAAGEALVRTLPDGGEAAPVEVMDRLAWDSATAFRPVGRRDGAVQVGGVNVFPERIAAIMAGHALVAACAVRVASLGGDDARTRLKAFVVPRTMPAPADLAAQLDAFAAEHLKPLERPVIWQFGEALPRNEMGKLADW